MRLLRLSAPSQRLRRIAKAYAAGEISEAEYRRVRRDIIDAFIHERDHDRLPADASGDDTEPRRGGDAGSDARSSEGPRRSPRHGRGKWGGAVISAALALLMLVALALAWGSLRAAVPEIPPVAERDPNPWTSPRLELRALRLRDEPYFPELGLDAASVHEFLQRRLSEIEAETAPAEHGFTEEELEEVARLLDSLGVHEPAAQLSDDDAAELLALIEQQKARRGVSILDLERLADELGRFYREHGLPLAVAYVPVQKPDDGVVELTVLPGRLARIRVHGDALPDELVEAAFAAQIGEVVKSAEISAVLYRINELPGLRAHGRFVAGAEVGATELDLDLAYERAWDARLRLDNHGSDATGEARTLVEGRWLNPSGGGDALGAGVLTAWDPANTQFGYIDYRRPVGGIDTEIGGRLSVDAFQWSDGGESATGRSRELGVGARHQLRRGRVQSTGLDLGVAWQRLRLRDDASGVQLQNQNVYLLSGRLSEERVLREISLAGLPGADLAVRLELGVDTGWIASGTGLDDGAVLRFLVDTSVWRMIELPWFENPEKLTLTLRGQTATGPLPGTLQQALGGAGASIGFDYPTLSVDDAVYGRLDLRAQPWREYDAGELLLFVDGAWGRRQRVYGSGVSARLASIGFGWEHRMGRQWTAQLLAGFPLADASSGISIDTGGPQLLLLLEYRP